MNLGGGDHLMKCVEVVVDELGVEEQND